MNVAEAVLAWWMGNPLHTPSVRSMLFSESVEETEFEFVFPIHLVSLKWDLLEWPWIAEILGNFGLGRKRIKWWRIRSL